MSNYSLKNRVNNSLRPWSEEISLAEEWISLDSNSSRKFTSQRVESRPFTRYSLQKKWSLTSLPREWPQWQIEWKFTPFLESLHAVRPADLGHSWAKSIMKRTVYFMSLIRQLRGLYVASYCIFLKTSLYLQVLRRHKDPVITTSIPSRDGHVSFVFATITNVTLAFRLCVNGLNNRGITQVQGV